MQVTQSRGCFGAIGMLAMLLVAVTIIGPDNATTTRSLLLLLMGAIFVLVARSTGLGLRFFQGIVAAAAISIVGGIAANEFGGEFGKIMVLVEMLALGTVVPVVLLRWGYGRKQVDLALLFAAITVYLLLGFSFANGYALVGAVSETPVFDGPQGAADGTYGDQLYFSFVTLTTTGYGDLSPHNGTVRTLAIYEAAGGQLYLLVAVTTILSALGSARHTR